MIPYILKRSSRKTLAIYVRDGEVEVRAPLKTAKHEIDRFVVSKEKWIAEKLAAAMARREQREAFSLNYGDMARYCGDTCPIIPRPGDRVGFGDGLFYMPPGLNAEQIRYACVQIYRMLAKRDLSERVFIYAKQMGVMPTAVRINDAKTRWGSCSGKKNLNFTWRLIMAERDVVDYVVVHELAHIIEMNHSDRFWAIVAGVLPDYKERQKRLDAFQRKLSIENWG